MKTLLEATAQARIDYVDSAISPPRQFNIQRILTPQGCSWRAEFLAIEGDFKDCTTYASDAQAQEIFWTLDGLEEAEEHWASSMAEYDEVEDPISFGGRDDLEATVKEWSGSIDMSCYELEYDELYEAVTQDILTYLRENFNFEWGKPIPNIPEEKFWEFFKPYDKI